MLTTFVLNTKYDKTNPKLVVFVTDSIANDSLEHISKRILPFLESKEFDSRIYAVYELISYDENDSLKNEEA